MILLGLVACDDQQTKSSTKASQKKKESQAVNPQPANELYDRIWGIFQDSKGNYWFGSNGIGLYRYNDSALTLFTLKDGLVDEQIRGIQEDKKGNIYIETPSGINRFDGQEFTLLPKSRSKNNEWKLLPDDLWFGYNADDLYRFDGDSLYGLKLPRQDLRKAFDIAPQGVPFEGLNNTPYAVFGVNKDKEGNVWFGTATAGAFRYDGESFLWFGEKELSTLPDGRVPGVRSMIQDKDGYFWLSNFYSKYKIDSSKPKGYEKMKAVDLPATIAEDELLYFTSGVTDKNGDLWMTVYGDGVWKYDGEKLTNFEVRNGSKEVLVVSVFMDAEGLLWLGTDNDGVYKQDGDNFVKFQP